MAHLNEEQKRFAVMCFARYLKRKGVVAALNERWPGLGANDEQIRRYDPTDIHHRKPGSYAKWRELYDRTREEFLKNITDVPIANAAVRLHELQELYEIAKQQKNTTKAAEFLAQAAKEVGGLYTAVREVKAKVDHTVSGEITVDEQRNILSDRLREMLFDAPTDRPEQSTQH